MKAVLAAAVLAVLAAVPARPPCDMKNKVKRWYCPKCEKLYPPNAVKARTCPEDKASLEQAEVCVRERYVAACHPDKVGDKPVRCCGVEYTKATLDESEILYGCEGCGVKSRTLSALKHADGCADRKVKKRCGHAA
jgi:RNase P subunit RPR2